MKAKIFAILTLLLLTSGVATAWSNVTVTLSGNYSEVVADGREILPGNYTNLDYPYAVMQDENAMEGIVALDGYETLSYNERAGRSVVSIKKSSRGRFLLPSSTGNWEDVEKMESRIRSGRFLTSSKPSFKNGISKTQEITITASFTNISILGPEIIDIEGLTSLRIAGNSREFFGSRAAVNITAS